GRQQAAGLDRWRERTDLAVGRERVVLPRAGRAADGGAGQGRGKFRCGHAGAAIRVPRRELSDRSILFRDQRWAKVSTEYDRRDRAECAANYGGELDDGVEEMSEMQRRASEREAEAKNRKPCQKKMVEAKNRIADLIKQRLALVQADQDAIR